MKGDSLIPFPYVPDDELFAAALAKQLTNFITFDRAAVPETLWFAALAQIDSAVSRTRNWHWWRTHPNGELNRLIERIDSALDLAQLAAAVQESENHVERELDRDLRAAAAAAATARRRRQTLPAQQARLAKQRAQRASLSDDEGGSR